MATTSDRLGQKIDAGITTEIVPLFEELRRFTDRRIAELSAEIHATVQMVDFSETNLSNQLSTIQQQVAVMVSAPSSATRNSGLELEAVVQATEAAANQIMEAAEAIGERPTGSRDVDFLEEVAGKLNSIFEACSFQDITGQRVRRAIQHLQQVELMLTEISPQQAASNAEAEFNPDLLQDAVDSLLGPNAGAGSNTSLGQDAVDSLFG